MGWLRQMEPPHRSTAMVTEGTGQDRILSVLPLPPHTLLLRVGTLGHDSAMGNDPANPDPDLFEDRYYLVSLTGIPGLSAIAEHWGLLRRVRVVGGGRAVAWPGWGGGEMVTVGVEALLGAVSAVQIGVGELRALTVPVRRRTRERAVAH